MEEHRAVRVAGCHQHRVAEPEAVVLRPRADELHAITGRGEFELHARISAAGLDVADRAVGVQVRARAAIEILVRVIRVD